MGARDIFVEAHWNTAGMFCGLQNETGGLVKGSRRYLAQVTCVHPLSATEMYNLLLQQPEYILYG